MYLSKKKVFFSAIILLLGVGLLSNEASAQEKAEGKLYGQVVEDTSGEAVTGVEITLQGMDKKATTGDKGMYAFKSLKTGTYTVVVEADGYQKWEKEVKVTAKGKRIDIKLKPTKG
ncbi:Carboxypeptidase regulatory-like domain-containing protein [Fodinibius salinus]|uniref:Carboxypeptidase regulatory-like domain-containing protein n=1 Tax=Fodinibius salinus TaxID=860790 RepID=A0A5D3YPA0_9BACT|nr:carboxypeptidase-like regulatory domain-containing protein [Fodinibius salinus]TYP95647.1 Carboxypeptidase regulatory-like domain-containing protein [Fodinibius salinus]